MKTQKVKQILLGLIVPVLILAAWICATHFGNIPTSILPKISIVWQAFLEMLQSGQLWNDLSVTLSRVLKGYLLSAVLGTVLGSLMGMSKTVLHLLQPTVTVIRQIPIIAWIPLIILWCGIGELSKVVVIVMAAFFPIMMNTMSGISSTPAGYIEVAQLYKLNFFKTFRKVYLPHALPQILVGLKLGLGCPGFDDYPLLENGKLAYDKGYLEEELNAAGYTLDLVTFQEAGPAINEAYASGELDMAFYGDYPAATAYSNGVDIRVIGVADKQMNAGVLAQKDAGIQSPKDLEGKKVIIGIGTNYQEYWKHLVDIYDIDESKVEIVNVVSDAASVFTTGEADAWLTLYYNVVYYENQGLGVDVENSVAHPEMASLWTVTGRNDFLQENPDAAVAVLKALQRAKEETVSNPDEFFHAIASPTLGVDVFRKAYGFDDTFAFLDSDIDSGVTDKLNYLSDFMLENGYISKAIDVDSFVDTSYYEKLKTSEQ